MDFFEQQHNARRQTRLMVLMFIGAVVTILIALNAAGAIIWAMGVAPENAVLDSRNLFQRAPRSLYVWISLVTLVIIAWGSISTLHKLGSGGVAVAKMVGARVVRRDTRDPAERRLLNIVEEMSIAAGITLPWAYVMDEEAGINAFAAGYSPNEAVIAVTRGAMETLTRDELQGVIGHEFSHILNGDMRLNIHLMGVIAGIVMIGSLGSFLMDVDRRRSSRDDNNRGGDLGARVFLMGLMLWLIGSIGVLAGRIIKAAISRQREFLADASAVQFTRNPEGISSALCKIGLQGAGIRERHAEELSHMYFGSPLSRMWNVFDTHPPIEERVERLMGPGALDELTERARKQPRPTAPTTATTTAAVTATPASLPEGLTSAFEAPAAAANPAPSREAPRTPQPPNTAPAAISAASTSAPATSAASTPVSVTPGSPAATPGAASSHAWGGAGAKPRDKVLRIVESVGNPTPAHYEAARGLLARIPAPLHEATTTPEGARALLFALLLGEGEVRVAQLAAITQVHGADIARLADGFVAPLRSLGPRARMPVMELIMPCLKELDADSRLAVLDSAQTLAEADRRMTLGEFVLLTLCRRHLSSPPKGGPPVKHKGFDTVTTEVVIVLSMIAHAGQNGEAAYAKGAQLLGLPANGLRPANSLGIVNVEAALYELKLLAPLKKPLLIKACFAVVMADEKLTVLEGELMRALCAALDSPLPPLLDITEPVQ